jgi:hypothetical protein
MEKLNWFSFRNYIHLQSEGAWHSRTVFNCSPNYLDANRSQCKKEPNEKSTKNSCVTTRHRDISSLRTVCDVNETVLPHSPHKALMIALHGTRFISNALTACCLCQCLIRPYDFHEHWMVLTDLIKAITICQRQTGTTELGDNELWTLLKDLREYKQKKSRDDFL